MYQFDFESIFPSVISLGLTLNCMPQSRNLSSCSLYHIMYMDGIIHFRLFSICEVLNTACLSAEKDQGFYAQGIMEIENSQRNPNKHCCCATVGQENTFLFTLSPYLG